MANHFSALKRARQTETRTERNRAARSRMRTALRSVREALTTGNKENAGKAYSAAVSVLDKSVKNGTLHKNTASRYKSRLAARLSTVGTK